MQTTDQTWWDEAVIETMRSQIEQLTSELKALKKTNKEQDERLRGWEKKAEKPCTECKLRGAALAKAKEQYGLMETQLTARDMRRYCRDCGRYYADDVDYQLHTCPRDMMYGP